MKKILVTGGAGFIGSNFLNKFVLENPNIFFVNLDRLTYAGKLENLKEEVKEAKNYAFEKVDLRDFESLKRVFEKHKLTDTIHFAAESHVDNSIKNPKIFTETNVLGTQNLLDLHREFGLKRFHQISTDEVYGEAEDGTLFTESTPLNPSSPYSASKAASDFLVKSYGRTFEIDFVITRCSNNYGPNQDSEKLIPFFIKLLKNGEKVKLYGDGKNVRDWLFVEDHCEAVWEVFCKSESGKVYNIGGNNEKTNLEITKILLKEFGKNESQIEFVKDRPGHDRRYAIDANNLKKEIGWEPKLSFEEGIGRTVEFFRKS